MFRTELKIDPSPWTISLSDLILSVGSCFAVNTGQKMTDFKFDALVNPFGVVYNPFSVFKLLKYSILKADLEDQGFLVNQGVVRHFDLHSDVSALSQPLLESRFTRQRDLTQGYLKQGRVMIITFGTASVFQHKEREAVVANCHKMPATHFTRYNLDAEEICAGFGEIYQLLKRENPGLRFILTVSPVRHIRDGLQASQLSKSILRVSIDRMVDEYADVSYFPAYEIMMDDLRDYRFYASDMVHPGEVAIDYIWEKFKEAFIDRSTSDFIDEWSKIRKNLAHKPFNPGSAEHRQFISKTIQQLERFKDQVDISAEKAQLEKQLNG
jgi:hypothetical protein